MAFVRTALTKEGYFVPNESDLGVKPSEFNSITENDYKPDTFSKLSRTVIYGSGLLLLGGLLAGCVPKPPNPDNGGGDGDSNSNTDSLCPNLLRIAAANSVHIDGVSRLPSWQAADPAKIQEDLVCFVPEATPLTIGQILTVGPNPGEEVIQLAWARGGEVTPLLAVPGETVDVNSDGTPDLQLVNFLDPHTSQWEALSPDQAQAQLAAVNINSASGDIEPEGSGVTIIATRDFNKNISFQIVNPDGTPVVLTAEQVKNNLALASWLTQVENLLTGQEMLSFDMVPGVDLSAAGEKFSLPQEVFALAREKHLAPIEAEGGIAAACIADSCTVMLTDVLVSGEKLQPASDGKVTYGFDGEAGSEALFRFSNLPEGVRATAFVAQEGNPWGLLPGTVVVWFWQGGGKGPTQILNLDNPLRIMADKPNSIQISAADNGFLVTTNDANGAVIDEQRVAFLPPVEPTPVLSQEEIEELAGLLTRDVCWPGSCIGPFKDNSSFILQVSTGIIERQIITDELGNEVAGVDVLQAVTRNKEDQPVVFKVVVQGWTKDNPNLNAYWWTYRRLFEGAEDENKLPKTVLPLEYIRQMFVKGLVFNSQVELLLGDGWLVVPDRDSEILFARLLLAQTANTEKMKIFLLSRGVEGADSDFLIATTFLGSTREQLAPLP